MTNAQTQPQTTPNLFQVTLTTDTGGPGDAEALRTAFSEGAPLLASPLTISDDDGYVTILFAGVDDDPTQLGANAALAIPGADIVASLAGFGDERSPTAAVVKALLTFWSVREAAGLPPRHDLRIDVVPAPALRQSSVSVSWSDGTPDDVPQFGTAPGRGPTRRSPARP